MRQSSTLSFAALAATTALAMPAHAVGVGGQSYSADLRPVGGLNADFDAEAPLPDLQADFTVDTSNANADLTEGTVSVGYQVEGSGFNDLSGIPGAAHLVHLHSQFPENAGAGTDKAGIVSQLSGPFLSGNGSDPVPSQPSQESAAGRLGGPGYLNFLEEVPELGPVSFYLGKTDIEAAPDGVSPLSNLLNKIQSGEINPKTYLPDGSEFSYGHTREFDLSDQDQRRLIRNVIGPDGDEFDQRVIDAHGFSVPNELSDAIDTAVFGVADPDRTQDTVNGFSTLLSGAPLGDGTEFRVTGPAVTGGDIVAAPAPVPLPAGLPLLFAGLGGLGVLGARRKFRA